MVEIGPWVSLFCLVGTPGVFIPGNVGGSSLLGYQEAKIVTRNLFFFFSFSPLKESTKNQRKEGEDMWGPHTYKKPLDFLFLKR